MTKTYIKPTQTSGAALFQQGIAGEVVMLNLLRFHELADYTNNPELAPDEPISGWEAYQKYMAHTAPYLRASGGELLFAGEGGNFLIGPMDEVWDMMLLVRHKSVEAFMTFAANEGYLAGAGHRTAALQDSRLLPLSELQGNNIL